MITDDMIYLTPTQTAAALGCEPQYLKAHEEELGLTPVKTPGGHRRYSLKDVERLVNRLTVAKRTDLALAKLLILRAKEFTK